MIDGDKSQNNRSIRVQTYIFYVLCSWMKRGPIRTIKRRLWIVPILRKYSYFDGNENMVLKWAFSRHLVIINLKTLRNFYEKWLRVMRSTDHMIDE